MTTESPIYHLNDKYCEDYQIGIQSFYETSEYAHLYPQKETLSSLASAVEWCNNYWLTFREDFCCQIKQDFDADGTTQIFQARVVQVQDTIYDPEIQYND